MSTTRTITYNPRALSIAMVVAVLSIIFASAESCDSQQGQVQRDENAAAGAGLGQILHNQPPPSFPYSQMRATLIEIETAQAKGVQTTSFFMHQGSPDPYKICPSIGLPVPNTASLTNPLQVQWGSGGGATVGQMDPNGAYVPEASSGTYVLCVASNSKPYAVYAEDTVHAETGVATWDYGKHQVLNTSQPTFEFSGGK